MTLTPEQLKARSVAIGGSDAAAVLGLSKRKTTLQLYMEKRGEWPEQDDEEWEEVRWWGNELEPVVRRRYATVTGRTIVLPEGTLRHPEHEFMLAHVDGIVQNERRGYEGKTAYRSIGWGDEGTDQVPKDALMQVHHYMTVVDFDLWDICALIGRRFKIYTVERDQEMSEMLIEAEKDFMRRVRESDAPPIQYTHKTALDVVRKLYPGTNGKKVFASEQAIGWRKALIAEQAVEKTAKAAAEAMKVRLLEEMGENAFLAFPDGKCYRRQKTNRVGYSVQPTTYMDTRFVNG